MRKIILLCSLIAMAFLFTSCSGTSDLFQDEVEIWYIEEYEEEGEIKTKEVKEVTTQKDLAVTPRRYTRIRYEAIDLDGGFYATTFDLSLTADSYDEFDIELKGFFLSYYKGSFVTDSSNKLDITIEKNVKIRSNKDFNLIFDGLDTKIVIDDFTIADAEPNDDDWMIDPDEEEVEE